VERPFSDFDLRSQQLVIQLGSCKFTNPKAVFTIDDVDLLSFAAPEGGVGLPQLNGIFCNDLGEMIFEIKDNEWYGPLDCWDMEIVGKQISIRSSPKKTALTILLNPPNEMQITCLDMRLDNCRVMVVDDLLILERKYNDQFFRLGMEADCFDASSCVYINSKIPEIPVLKKWEAIGGEGIKLFDCGIVFGKEAGQAFVRQIAVWDPNLH